MVTATCPRRKYLSIWGSLLLLTLVTVGAAMLPLGAWHTPVALLIAALKATLVAIFFMHLDQSDRLMVLVFIGALLWLAILFVPTLGDYATRAHLTD